MKYEYKLVSRHIRFDTRENLEIMLNSEGKEGWKLCGIDDVSFIFKRKVEANEAP